MLLVAEIWLPLNKQIYNNYTYNIFFRINEHKYLVEWLFNLSKIEDVFTINKNIQYIWSTNFHLIKYNIHNIHLRMNSPIWKIFI